MTDQTLIEAERRWREAHAVYDGLPHAEEGEPTDKNGYTAAEAEQWRIIDAQEAVIQAATATTPEGVAIQLWLALAHAPGFTDRATNEAIQGRDLAYLGERESDFDWDARLIFAALRSLQAQGAAL